MEEYNKSNRKVNFTWYYEELLSLPKTMNQTDFHHTLTPIKLNTFLSLPWYRQVVNKT